jgi:hypothetical protein
MPPALAILQELAACGVTGDDEPEPGGLQIGCSPTEPSTRRDTKKDNPAQLSLVRWKQIATCFQSTSRNMLVR